MRYLIITILAVFLISSLGAVIEETASLKNFLLGSEPNCAYDRWVSHLAEGIASAGYNTYAPYDRQLSGFGNFVVPSVVQLLAWSGIVDLFLVGELDMAQAAIQDAGFPYQVVIFHDTDSGRNYHMLREIPDFSFLDDNNTLDAYDDEFGAFTYGWGLYIYNPAGNRPIIVTTPHPCDDFPTTSFSYEAFNLLNAKFLLINGAGREVRWTNVAPYNNAKSLSDPTRTPNHPFNAAYYKFADTIRAEFNMREFSIQIHTYDWNFHAGYPNTQISAGYNKMCPNLPIRDLSSLKRDLINMGNHLMIPENTIGLNAPVYLNDFYSVNYDIHEFTFNDGEHEYSVNDYIDLPAYSQNQQMLYTLNGWNDYDTYEPFFHMEMDELPNAYDVTENNYKWFYGWNENLQRWDFDNLDTYFNSYYMRWVEDLNLIIDEVFTMNDQLVPPAPTNLAVQNQSLNHITLSWSKTDSYDFSTYEILYATEPIGDSNYQVFDRTSAAFLASPHCESINVTGLANSNSYFFRIRAKDKNGNISPLSNEVTTVPAPANVYSFTAHGLDNMVRLYWAVAGQTNNQGFSVYRKPEGGTYSLLDSYQTNTNLTNPTAGSFEYWDANVQNGSRWTYMVSSTNTGNLEFFHNYPATAVPMPIHRIFITNQGATLQDSVNIAINPFASDGQDSYYDVAKANPSGISYVWNAFWQPYWGSSGTQLLREVKGAYDLDNDVKSWTMRVSSNQLNVPLFITASVDFNRAEKLYLYDSGNSTWHNLMTGSYQFMVTDTNVRTMTIYWGNLQPKAVHGNQNNRLYQGGNSVSFYWSCQNAFLIDHLDIYIKNDTDSLLVAGNLPSTATSYAYIVPQLANIQRARFYVDVHAVDGIVRTYPSSYYFAFLPTMNLHYNESGWQTRSKPWGNDLVATIEQVYGSGSTALVPGVGGTWVPEDDFLFGTGYWVNSSMVNFYSSMAAINTTETLFPVQNGWNLVPNPHLCEYPVHSIRFTVNGTVFRYSEMIQQQLISRGVYVYSEGTYRLVETILPYESFLIKYYGSQALNTLICFYPFFEAPEIIPPAPDWQFNVKVSSPITDAADITIGAAPYATDGYEFAYDLPVSPVKPFNSLHTYLLREAPGDELFLDSRLGCEIRAPFTGEIQQEKTWYYSLEVPSTDPITFHLSSLDLPANYTVRVYIHGQGHTYSDASTFTFMPPTAGIYSGLIRVNNHYVSNTDLIMPPLSAIKVYPNPFNPSTTIAFSTPKKQPVSVELYNIKGQKVRSLYSGVLDTGNHYLVWDGKDSRGQGVGSGIYFAKLSTPELSRSIKMILMK